MVRSPDTFMNPILASPAGAQGFTVLFALARTGDRAAANLVYGMALPRLKKIAHALLNRHRSHLTLQATALIGELFLKLRGFNIRIADREHFFHLSARAMHQVLADRGRTQAAREANAALAVREANPDGGALSPECVCAIRCLLDRFAKVDRGAANILRRHYLEGYTWEELSRMTGMPEWKVRRDAAFALSWMRDHFI